MPFVLGHYLEEIHSLLVSGVFLSCQSQETGDVQIPDSYASYMDIEVDCYEQAKVRLVPKESSLSITAGSAGALASAPASSLSYQNHILQLACLGSVACLISTCLKEIEKKLETGCALEEKSILAAAEWLDVDYDVSSQKVSIHIPLHRLLALLLQKALERHCGASAATNGISSRSGSPSLAVNHGYFSHLLGGCSTYSFSSFLMEHPLRVRVFCAQVYAGMWRKNGYAAFYACELYGNVQWSDQCLELDLFMLQCCAALAPADSFVNRIIKRFGLSNYLSVDVKQTSEYEPTLVKEMLSLLIQIVKERRFCGSSIEESLKRELIRRLAIGDATRSQLFKALPPDLKINNKFSDILDDVASYSNPSGFNQGKYSLRKKYWNDLDLYHPRWRPKDLQVAEERYLQFCGTFAMTTQLPRWSMIYHPLDGIARVATCKVVLQLMRAVIFYACATDNQTPARAPDGVLLTALHLLSLALDVCSLLKRSNGLHHAEDPIPLLALACEKIDRVKNDTVEEHSLLSLLVLLTRKCMTDDLSLGTEGGNHSLFLLTQSLLKKFAELDISCINNLRVLASEVVGNWYPSGASNSTGNDSQNRNSDKHKEKGRLKQAAILAKMKADQSKFLESINSAAGDEMDESGALMEEEKVDDIDENVRYEHVCSLCHAHSRSPLSIPVLLQKSRLVRFLDKGPASGEPVHEPEKKTSVSSEMVPALQIDDSATDMMLQSTDTYNYKGCVDPFSFDNEVSCQSTKTKGSDLYSYENLEADLYSSIWKDVHDEMNDETKSSIFVESSTNLNADLSFIKKYIAGVSEPRIKNHSDATITNSLDNGIVSGSSSQFGYDGLTPADCDGVFLSSCGHAVHQECLDRYLWSLKKRVNRRVPSEDRSIVDPNQGEFLCPVCRLLANSAMPQCFPKLQKQQIVTAADSSPARGHSETSKDKLFHIRQALVLLRTTALVVSSSETLDAFPDKKNERAKENSSPFLLALKSMYLARNGDEGSTLALGSDSTVMWDALKYSLIATEIGARSSITSLSPSYGLESLFAGAKSAGKDLLSSLLEASNTKRTEKSTEVLLRIKGIQLFSRSVCLLHPGKTSAICASELEWNSSRLLNKLNRKIPRHDAIFWEQASDPVLAHDPFSSLMWIFFCLPSPFLACWESFISVVHLFYVVSVTQAIITYCGESKVNKCEISSQDGLINDVLKALSEDKFAQHFFASKYFDPNCGINEFIHRVTFPYLRRCALLSRLLGFSTLDQILNKSTHEVSDTVNTLSDKQIEEFTEVKRLHNVFGIPPLDDVLKDETLRGLAMGWYQDWENRSRKDKLRNIIYSTPAVPFKLKSLPYIYQDLLQRYINQPCGECGSVPKEPALCLLCGKICSRFWKPCCRGSGCKLHATTCGAGTGIYLLIRKTTIILHSVVRQTIWPSPYLDAFGEEDVGLQRGRPLFLNEERYATLCYMVATHGLDRNSKVLREATAFD
uniref:E3 ubiquitin-protein ligase n=1 Tax=Kalanchoe fedtschenkoi TaxID=63787 RepID=A0A7N0VB90_KALFE